MSDLPAITNMQSLPSFTVGAVIKTSNGRMFAITTIIQHYIEDDYGEPMITFNIGLTEVQNKDSN